MSELRVKRVESSDEENSLRRLATQAFNFDEARWQSFLTIVSRKDLRIAVARDEVVGGLSFYPIGQWFGSKRVPMAALALVLMAPEYRGRGHANRMLSDVLHELREDGFALATLYASTQTVYRRVGFEQAGNRYDWYCSLREIDACRPELPMRRVDALQHRELLQSLATQRAKAEQGCLDRNDGMWNRLFRELHGTVFTYVVGEPGNESGYLIYDQSRHVSRASPAEYSFEQRSLNVRDMVALNDETMQSIWAFIVGNRSVTELVSWSGPAIDIRSVLPPEYAANVVEPCRWMTRLLNVKQALLDRGYPKLDASVGFDITDDVIAENNGAFTLRLRNGEPTIEDASSESPIRINVRDLAPLYSGLWTASQLSRFGRLSCEDDSVVDMAAQVFASSEPWMPDSF